MGQVNACYRELGAELRRRREAANVTPVMIAEETGWSRSKISRMETGHSSISAVDLVFYLAACRNMRPEQREGLLEFCQTAANNEGYWLSPRDEHSQSSLNSLIFHESGAGRRISYEPFLVPGLLQTPAYARTRIVRGVAHMTRDVDETVGIRMKRQAVLNRRSPGEFVFFVHEQALRTQAVHPRIMHEQLLHMVLMAALGHVTLRVVPAAREPSTFGGPISLFEFPQNDPLLYMDGFLTGVFIERCDVVDDYFRYLIPELRAVALGPEDSRALVAKLADEYDRKSPLDVQVEQQGQPEWRCLPRSS
jgi:hypothetical protein